MENTCVFIHLIDVAFTNMVHYWQLNKLAHIEFQFWTRSDILAKRVAEELCRHLNLTERVLETPNSKDTKNHFVDHGNIIDSKIRECLFARTFRESKMKWERIQGESGRKLSHLAENTETHATTTSSTQSDDYSEYRFSHSALLSTNVFEFETKKG